MQCLTKAEADSGGVCGPAKFEHLPDSSHSNFEQYLLVSYFPGVSALAGYAV